MPSEITAVCAPYTNLNIGDAREGLVNLKKLPFDAIKCMCVKEYPRNNARYDDCLKEMNWISANGVNKELPLKDKVIKEVKEHKFEIAVVTVAASLYRITFKVWKDLQNLTKNTKAEKPSINKQAAPEKLGEEPKAAKPPKPPKNKGKAKKLEPDLPPPPLLGSVGSSSGVMNLIPLMSPTNLKAGYNNIMAVPGNIGRNIVWLSNGVGYGIMATTGAGWKAGAWTAETLAKPASWCKKKSVEGDAGDDGKELEEVNKDPEPPMSKAEKKAEAKAKAKAEAEAKAKAKIEAEEAKKQAKLEAEEAKKKAKEAKPEVKEEVKPEAKEVKPEVKDDKPEVKEVKPETKKAKGKDKVETEDKPEVKDEEVKPEEEERGRSRRKIFDKLPGRSRSRSVSQEKLPEVKEEPTTEGES